MVSLPKEVRAAALASGSNSDLNPGLSQRSLGTRSGRGAPLHVVMTFPVKVQTSGSSNNITASASLARWLIETETSFAFTSYQTGQLFLVGVRADGSISVNQQNYYRAMGLSAAGTRLVLASQYQVWTLDNMLHPGQVANGEFDAAYVPRRAQTTGDIDLHELASDAEGQVIFVNTRYNCIAGLDPAHSFRPLWKPAFIDTIVGEDRCHLNGMAMQDGRPAYATAAGETNIIDGWRDRRGDGGILIDVASSEIVARGLSMPHSPRVYGSTIVLLDSGRGCIVQVDPATGTRRDIAFLPGFLRGLAICGTRAFVTLSKPRTGSFGGLPLDAALADRGQAAWCAVVLVDLLTGQSSEWLRIDGKIGELFDVVALPGVRCPMSIGADSAEIRATITYPPMKASGLA